MIHSQQFYYHMVGDYPDQGDQGGMNIEVSDTQQSQSYLTQMENLEEMDNSNGTIYRKDLKYQEVCLQAKNKTEENKEDESFNQKHNINLDLLFKDPESLNREKKYEKKHIRLVSKSSFENHKEEQDYYKLQNILKDYPKVYYQQIHEYYNQEKNLCSSSNCFLLLTKMNEYTENEYIITYQGIQNTKKNTNTSEITIGRQQHITVQEQGVNIQVRPNDITPGPQETDTDISRMHCKLVHEYYTNENSQLLGGFRYFQRIVARALNQFQMKAQQNDKEFLYKYQSTYRICKYVYELGFIFPILKKFIVPQRAAYLVDFKSQNGTKILIGHENFTRLYSHMTITIGINSLIYFEQINSIQKLKSFEDVIANCIYDQLRLLHEIETQKWQLEVTVCFFGLDEEIEEDIITHRIVKQAQNYFKNQQNGYQRYESFFYDYSRKEEVITKIKELIKDQQKKNPGLFSARPYIRALVKYDDSTPHIIKPYYLFHNYQNPNRAFKIGRLDTNHIQIRFRYVSRRNTEIVYRNNQWLIRDGFEEANNKRKPSTEKTWVNLIGFESPSNYVQNDIKCIYTETERNKTEEIGPYPLKDQDIFMCGKNQKFQIQYINSSEQKNKNEDFEKKNIHF